MGIQHRVGPSEAPAHGTCFPESHTQGPCPLACQPRDALSLPPEASSRWVLVCTLGPVTQMPCGAPETALATESDTLGFKSWLHAICLSEL